MQFTMIVNVGKFYNFNVLYFPREYGCGFFMEEVKKKTYMSFFNVVVALVM